jgi:hypothetical protein
VNVVDLISAAYVAFGAVRGRKRGLADEAYRLLRVGISFAAGCGLYGLMSDLLKNVLSLGADVSGPVGFVATMAGAWALLRMAKRRLTAWIAARFASHAAIGGAVAGGIRSLVWVLALVSAFHLAGSAPGRQQVSEQSLVGRIAGWVVK